MKLKFDLNKFQFVFQFTIHRSLVTGHVTVNPFEHRRQSHADIHDKHIHVGPTECEQNVLDFTHPGQPGGVVEYVKDLIDNIEEK